MTTPEPPFSIGGLVEVVGDDRWDGSIYRGCRGTVVGRLDPGLGGERSAWVVLDPPPPNCPDGSMVFRLSTLRPIGKPLADDVD